MATTKVKFTSQSAWETQQQLNANFDDLDGRVDTLEEQIVNAGKVDDVKINGTSIVSSKEANFNTKSTYNSETNKIVTETDIADFVTSTSVANTYVPQTRTINNKPLSTDISLSATDVGALPNTTKYASSISMTMDSTTYILTAQLKDQEGNNLGTAQTIDLPLESVVVSGSYDNTTKKVVLTLKDGSTVEFSVADLVSGLQTEITSSNKLSADLVKDGTTNKVFTATEKTKLSGIETGAEVNVQSDWNQSNSTADDYIKNKPVIPENDDFTLSGLSEKSYNSLTDKPTIPDMPVELSFTNSDSRWSSVDSDGFYTLKITSSKTPDNVFKTDNSKKKQVLAGLDYDGTYIYVVTDTKFSGIVTAH